MGHLILVRHGESLWNLANKFTGWVDVPLSQAGVEQAMESARKLSPMEIHHAFASDLDRTHETLTIILARQKLTGVFLHPNDRKKRWYEFSGHSEATDIPIHTTPLLNERYYGDLQGLEKDEARKQYGEEKVAGWRRGYSARPPGGESLEDVYKRVVPFFKKRVMPFLEQDKNVIISSHGNTLRALLKYIHTIPDDEVPKIDLPPGEVLQYDYHASRLTPKDDVPHFNRPMFWVCKDGVCTE